MESLRKKIFSRWFAAVVCVLGCVFYYQFFVNRAFVQVTIDVSKPTYFKLYWSKGGQLFSEKKMKLVWVVPSHKKYSFYLTNLHYVDRVRIDPVQYEGTSRIESLVISQEGIQPIHFTTKDDFQKLKPLFDIKEYSIDDQGLSTVSSGIDPNFEYTVQLVPKPVTYSDDFLRMIAIILCTLIFYWMVADLKENLQYVPHLLCGAFLLAATMAAVSENNVHPDEMVHLEATKYYLDHWNPPHVDDPAIRSSYSPYGFSRLNFNEIYYLLNGKFVHLLEPMNLSWHVACRTMNVFLFLFITALTVYSIPARYVAIPLLVSPQIWYVFSYCNSDALGVFACFIAASLIVDRGSVLHRFLTGTPCMMWVVRGAVSAVCLGMLLVIKKNYYPFIGIALVFLLMDIWRNFAADERKKIFIRIGVLCCLGAALFVYKKAADYAVNGLDRTQKVRAMQLATAQPLYHPDTPLEKQHPQLSWKERGVSLKYMVYTARWFEKTFRSAFGVYGYTSLSGSFGYYDLIRWCGLALLIYFFMVIAMKGGLFYTTQATVVAAASIMLIAASFYHSYVNDFQAQGRYLLPIFMMLAILCGQTRQLIEKRIFSFGVCVMFMLSSYSFIAIALQNIPRPVLQ